MDRFLRVPMYGLFFVVLFLSSSFSANANIEAGSTKEITEPTKETVQLWDRLRDFLGSSSVTGADRMAIGGADFKTAISGGMPGLDEYLHQVLEHVESLEVSMQDGRIVLEVVLDDEKGLTLSLRNEEDAKTGQLYSLVFSQNMRLELRSFKDNVYVEKISGIKAMVKIPVLPDAIFFESVEINGSDQILTIRASTLWKMVHVIAKLDLKNKEFTGIDWWDTIFKNIPSLVKHMYFRMWWD